MAKVNCINCKGSGRVFASMSLTTREVKYRTCPVCSGTGFVESERSYFTQYPDLSLQKAMELMRIHGKPVEINIVANHDIRVLFKDGARYILGGFTVGYKGTGPGYTKKFLDAAGFDVSLDEIEEMKPPITLVAGKPYILEEALIIKASTVEEAKKKVNKTVPSDAKVIAIDVMQDGTPQTKEGEGFSKENALENAKRLLPKDAEIIQEKVTQEGKTGAIHFIDEFVQAYSEQEALKIAKKKLPVGAEIKSPYLAKHGDERISKKDSIHGEKLKIEAFSEEEAIDEAISKLPKGASIPEVIYTKSMSKGFLGLGRKPGVYEIIWLLPWYIIPWKFPTKVALTYKQPASIKVRFQPPSK